MANASNSIGLRLAVEEVEKNVYISKCLPLRMGNAARISYGGFQLGVALNAACQTAQPNHYLYSATGYYLGPVSIDSKIKCLVEEIRNTRTFSTRQIKVMQGDRLCLLVNADFRVAEKSLLTYTIKPSRDYTYWEKCKTRAEGFKDLLDRGLVTEKQVEIYETSMKEGLAYWHVRAAPEGIFSQNLNGAAKNVQTTQDHLSLTEKTTAEWTRFKQEVNDNDQMAALGFLSDAALSFLPLSLNHQFLDDAGPCSSLDFALRVFSNSINLSDWHLSEKKTIRGDLGLTHSVANIFDSSGHLVAQMSQQSILRPKAEKGKI